MIIQQLKQLEEETFDRLIGDYDPDSHVGDFIAQEVWHGVMNSIPDYLSSAYYGLKYDTLRPSQLSNAVFRAKAEGYVPELPEEVIKDLVQRLEVYVLVHTR